MKVLAGVMFGPELELPLPHFWENLRPLTTYLTPLLNVVKSRCPHPHLQSLVFYDSLVNMKTKSKESVSVRISLKDYEVLRRLAFKKHKPMTEILEEIIKQHALKSTGKANS